VTGIIYAYTHNETGRIYVGQTTRQKQRHKEHVVGQSAAASHIDRAFLKHGADAFAYEVLVADVPAEDLNDWERFFVWQLQSYGHGYNMDAGGGFDRETARRRWQSAEYRAKMLAAFAARGRNEQTRRKLSETQKRRAAEPGWHLSELWKTEGRKSAHLKRNEEMHKRQDYREKMKAVFESESFKAAAAEKNRRIAGDPEWRRRQLEANRAANCRAVVCVETGVVYVGLSDASRETGANLAKICNVCKGSRKTAGGYRWRYATPEESATLKPAAS
jgi:group I intron endonuclease